MTELPGAVDHHVHLGLVERDALAGGALVKVIDCGWDPDEALSWRTAPPRGVEIEVAGPFHTATGGYPAGRVWAPDAAVRQIGDVDAARRAAAVAAAGGYDAFKIALHDGMPLLGDELLDALVGSAQRLRLRVFVHAEGRGQAMRAVRAGADVLVHTPWTEELTDREIEECVDRDVAWVSTLGIHAGDDRTRALSNLRRFHAAGGSVRYGTDMGNGEIPVGVSLNELEALEAAGISGQELRATILVGTPTLRSPVPLPETAAALADWLESSERV